MSFFLGRKQILKLLLHIQREFNNCEPHHVFNGLYITDYCVWIQTVPEKLLLSLSEEIAHCQLSKENMELDLLQLESNIADCADEDTSCDSDDSSSSDSTSGDSDSQGPDSDDSESVESLNHVQYEASVVKMKAADECNSVSKVVVLEDELAKLGLEEAPAT